VVQSSSAFLDAGHRDWWRWRGRGLAYAVLGQWEQAQADFNRALAEKPDDVETLLARGRAHAELNRWVPALADWTQAAEYSPNDRDLWYLCGLAEVRRRGGDLAKALAAFTRAVELGPESKSLRLQRGLVLARLQRWPEAADDVTRAVELGEDSVSVRHQQVLLCLAAGRLDAYRRGCADVLARFGTEPDTNLANTLAWIGTLGPLPKPEADHCVRLAERALAAAPQPYTFHNTLGGALVRAGRYEDAVRRLHEAIQRHGKGGTAWDWLFLALAQQHLGRTDEARKSLANARAWIDRAAQGKLKDEPLPTSLSWDLRLELHVLQREVEELTHQR
jgi:tetratricopeptide (TPR) repeat protein